MLVRRKYQKSGLISNISQGKSTWLTLKRKQLMIGSVSLLYFENKKLDNTPALATIVYISDSYLLLLSLLLGPIADVSKFIYHTSFVLTYIFSPWLLTKGQSTRLVEVPHLPHLPIFLEMMWVMFPCLSPIPGLFSLTSMTPSIFILYH